MEGNTFKPMSGSSKTSRRAIRPSKWHKYKRKGQETPNKVIKNEANKMSKYDNSTSKQFEERLTLASVMAMEDEELRTSPFSTPSSSSNSSNSSAWDTIEEIDD